MGESLYSLLGVREDADPETIRRAYRERASDVHPDVSDAPDATRRFKRLTVARDTLVDEDERARYDRLGLLPEPPVAVRDRRSVRHGRPPRDRGRRDCPAPRFDRVHVNVAAWIGQTAL
ncbi:DnaJ domain-containing protein [Halapricum desulfuricans]|uniref:J domain-containing protein n=1 Tax=Halapricum desulfuricans TaxID=2841257 RepID=A0A897N3V6_9EURY|nr:DnaJ domain-containing protein [Halapricum desulfuricans]QSG09070.1 hypothetical protein HSR122_1679 [Halapricum desulfuricans]